MKICKRCGESKSLDLFSKNRAARDGLVNNCKPCEIKRVKEWERLNPKKVKAWSEKNRTSNLRASLPANTTQVCNKCGIEKPLNQFGKNCRRKNNVRLSCKECNVQMVMKKYKENPQAFCEKTGQWRRNNPEKHRRYSVAYIAQNREKLNELRRQYRLRNIERERKKDAEYLTKNRAKIYAKNARRRAAEKKATPNWLSFIHKAQIEEFYEIALAKNIQTGIEHAVDHIVPLRGKTIHGLHVPWNLQILTKAENSRKYNKLLIDERSI